MQYPRICRMYIYRENKNLRVFLSKCKIQCPNNENARFFLCQLVKKVELHHEQSTMLFVFRIHPPVLSFDSKSNQRELHRRDRPTLLQLSNLVRSRIWALSAKLLAPQKMQTFNLFKTPDTRYRESQKVLPYARASLGSVYLPNEFLFDPGIKEVTNGLCRCATFPFSTSHRMNNMYTGLKAVGYRKGREKNALMSLKEKRSQRENVLEVMFQVKRGSFTRDPYFLPPSCFCEFIRDFIFCSFLHSSLLRTLTITSWTLIEPIRP